MQIGEKPLSDEERARIKILAEGKMPDDAELEERKKKAAAGKVKVNGIMRHPNEKFRP